MRLETIIRAWRDACGIWLDYETGQGISRARMERGQRQEGVFWDAVMDRIADYRSAYINNIAQDIQNYCARDDAGFWPYRKRHARYINELVALGVMELAQREQARWRFVEK